MPLRKRGSPRSTSASRRSAPASPRTCSRMLGYPTFAHYRLDDAMAKTPEAVRALLDRVWAPARRHAMEDRDALQSLVQAEGGNFALAPWDWRYYAEKLRKARCDIDEA